MWTRTNPNGKRKVPRTISLLVEVHVAHHGKCQSAPLQFASRVSGVQDDPHVVFHVCDESRS